MKNRIYQLQLVVLSVTLIFASCSDEPEAYGFDAEPGFSIAFNADSESIAFTKNPDETVVGEVDISGEFFVTANGLYDRVILMKSLVTSSNEVIESVLQERELAFGKTVAFSISDTDELFEGMQTAPNDITVGSRFQFTPLGITPEADTVSVQAPFIFEADYFAFCNIPQLELGTYTVTNTNTMFSKEVELFYDEELSLYVFNDFGIDWSNWEDFWYGTAFSLACPLVDGNPAEVNLSGIGADTALQYEMKDDDGVLTTRNLRRMPYIYKEGSATGYYNNETGELIFKDVSVTDAWWDADQHDFSMVFKKKE